MSKVLVTESHLEDIADAIRAKLDVETTYKPGQMAAAIESIPTGITPTGTINITENGEVDVTNYATANVAVSGGGGSFLSGTDVPSAATGNNGDVYLQYLGSPSLPSGYTNLGYIGSNGTDVQWIDTGYMYNQYSRIEAMANVHSFPSNYPHLFVSWSGNAYTSWYFCTKHVNMSNQTAYIFNSGEGGIGAQIPSDTLLIVEASRTGAKWSKTDGTEIYSKTINGGTTSSNVSLKIFSNCTADSKTNLDLYYLKIFEGDTLVHYYVPCKNSSNVAGLYDLIGETFYANSGSGTLIEGETTNMVLAAYAKVNGAWQNLIGTDIEDIT